MPKVYTLHPSQTYLNDTVQIECRCPECNKLLFAYQVQSHAVLETVCPRCHKPVRAEIYPDDPMPMNSDMIRKAKSRGERVGE
jgi:phage FluMu protein Com